MNEHKTFEELERLAYMSNLPKIASLYAQLDDNEKAEDEIERPHDKIHDLKIYHQSNSEALERKVEALENKLEKITDIINE